jgi:hypothetical protein
MPIHPLSARRFHGQKDLAPILAAKQFIAGIFRMRH